MNGTNPLKGGFFHWWCMYYVSRRPHNLAVGEERTCAL